MSILLNFINNHKKDLVQVYVQERQSCGGIEGLLWIIQTPDNQANVSYVCFEDLPDMLMQEVNNHRQKQPSDSIIYFYVCDPLSAQIIQIDLRQFNAENSQMIMENTYEPQKNINNTNPNTPNDENSYNDICIHEGEYITIHNDNDDNYDNDDNVDDNDSNDDNDDNVDNDNEGNEDK